MKEELEKLGLKLTTKKVESECIYFKSQGDWNDADYVDNEGDISFEEFEELLPILKKIGNVSKIKKIKKILTEDEYYKLHEVLPYGYHDIHTIEYLYFEYHDKTNNIIYSIEY